MKDKTDILSIATILLVSSPLHAQQTPGNAPIAETKKDEAEKFEPRDDFDFTKGWLPRFFQPSLRVYFDIGTDDAGEIDLYNDGSLVPTINLVELYRPYPVKEFFLGKRDLWIGPAFGIGLTAPAKDGEGKNAEEAGNAPVLLLTGGLLTAIPLNDKTRIGIESGLAWGISADEGLADADDTAVYVGIALKIDF